MIALPFFLHTCSVALCTLLAAAGVSFGHARTGIASMNALYRQPAQKKQLFRSTIIALALIETASLIGLMISIILFFSGQPSLPRALGEIGVALSIGIPAFVVGWFSGGPTSASLDAIVRQPFISRQLTNFSILALSLIQTPLIFGLIVALFINRQLPVISTVGQGLTLIGAGIAIGFGSIGPVIGGCTFSAQALASAGKNKAAVTKLFAFTFISQALVESPIIFSTLIALSLTQIASSSEIAPLLGVVYLFVGATIGLGSVGPGIGSGYAAAAAAEQIGIHPEQYTALSRTSIITQSYIGTIAIYALIIAFLQVVFPL